MKSVTQQILLPHLHARRRPVAVVSAMLGVTNRLVEAAGAARDGRASAVREIRHALRRLHVAALDELCTERDIRIATLHHVDRSFAIHFDEVTERIASHKAASNRDMDAISSAGERWSAHLLAAHLEDRGIDGQLFEADEVLVTDEVSGNAKPLLLQTRARVNALLLPVLERGAVPVITGFFGSSQTGLLTTLGRGGTDLTAAVIGACVAAAGVKTEILLWKVEHSIRPDGVMQWEPGWEGVVHDALPHVCIPVLSYDEAGALAHFGKKVLHPDTVLPAIELGIPIGVRNTLNPSNPGTLINGSSVGMSSVVRQSARLRTVTSVSVSAYEARHGKSLGIDWNNVLPSAVGGKEHAALVALVGDKASCLDDQLLARVINILKAANVHACVPFPHTLNMHALVVMVPDAQRKVAVRSLHAAFASEFDTSLDLTGLAAECTIKKL